MNQQHNRKYKQPIRIEITEKQANLIEKWMYRNNYWQPLDYMIIATDTGNIYLSIFNSTILTKDNTFKNFIIKETLNNE